MTIGTNGAGFAHILEHHPVSQFTPYFGVTSESQLSSLIYNTVATQTPVQILSGGQYIYTINGNKLSVITGNNGFIVTAHPIS